MAEERVERRLAAILAADVVGYSLLMANDEEQTLGTLRTYREMVERLIGERDGRAFGVVADSMMAEFPSPVQAVRCAVEIQEELALRNSGLPEERRMHFRIGINLGDIMVEGGNLFGDGVNIAARLEGLAKPGGVCVSESIYQQVRNKIELGYEPLGEHSVKNIAEPVTAYHVLTTPEAAAEVLGKRQHRIGERRWVTVAVIVVAIAIAGGVAIWLITWQSSRETRSDVASAVPQAARPTRHFRVERAADLEDADALTIYDRIRDDMAAAYRQSNNPYAGVYQTWRRYNTAPYLSKTHGRRYVSNYGNGEANAYGLAEDAGTLPEGSVLAKDSFEVTELGDVVTGPLSVMEKMPAGFNPESRDWRYTAIMPDGSLFGTTKGGNSGRVEFCIECHIAAGADRDHLFLVPEKYRVRFLER